MKNIFKNFIIYTFLSSSFYSMNLQEELQSVCSIGDKNSLEAILHKVDNQNHFFEIFFNYNEQSTNWLSASSKRKNIDVFKKIFDIIGSLTITDKEKLYIKSLINDDIIDTTLKRLERPNYSKSDTMYIINCIAPYMTLENLKKCKLTLIALSDNNRYLDQKSLHLLRNLIAKVRDLIQSIKEEDKYESNDLSEESFMLLVDDFNNLNKKRRADEKEDYFERKRSKYN